MTSSASSVSSNSRLLFTVEILDSIISFNSASDATRCARVCRVWLEVSLDHIWADVQGFRPLFGIFAPLQHPEENGEPLDAPLVFSRNIGTDDWNRLAIFSRRVRSFTILQSDKHGEDGRFIDDSVFKKVLSTRPAGVHFLPLLQTLVIRSQGRVFERAEEYLFVLNKNIRTLDIQALRYPSSAKGVAYFMSEVAIRCPNLRILMFQDSCKTAAFLPYINDVFTKFRYLEAILLSSCSLNAAMLSALSILPNLHSIGLGKWGTNGRTGDTHNIQDSCIGSKSARPFPSLRRFFLQSRVSDITEFLSGGPSNFAGVVDITLDIISASPSDNLSSLLRTISLSLRNLKVLHIGRMEDLSDAGATAGSDAITYGVLRNLRNIPFLEVFSLQHTQRWSINNQELADVILSCKQLRRFQLHRDPLANDNGRSSVTLDILGVFAGLHPSETLEELLLDLDGTVIPDPRPLGTNCLSICRVHFGLSELRRKDTGKVAAYLESVLRPYCKIETGFRNVMDNRRWSVLSATAKCEVNERVESWKIVVEALELSFAVKRRSEHETFYLRRSISDLTQELDDVRRRLSEATRQGMPANNSSSPLSGLVDLNDNE